MIRAPRTCFWMDQARAGVVAVFVLAACLAALNVLRIPQSIESKALDAKTEQGG